MPHPVPETQPYLKSTGKISHTKKVPHLRLTFEEILSRRDFVRCDQYLADILASMKAIGWKFVIHDIPKFAESIGLSMRTFQRARKLLIESGRLIEDRLNRDSIEFFLVRDDDTPIAQDDTSIAVTPPEPAPQAELSAPSDLYSDHLSDPLSVPPTTPSERETLEILDSKGKPIPAFKDWLESQARKMPRAIANIPVWIAAMAKRDEWQEGFLDWLERSRQNFAEAVPLSPSTEYEFVPLRTEQELSEIREAIAAARSNLRIVPPARKTHLQ